MKAFVEGRSSFVCQGVDTFAAAVVPSRKYAGGKFMSEYIYISNPIEQRRPR